MTPETRLAAGTAEERLRALGRLRTRTGLLLTGGVVAIYFGFIGSVAFAKPLLGRQITPGLSVGILFGAFVIVAAWLLTLIYVRWANARYDPALRALRDGRLHRGDPEAPR
jgi:uncharacterized membrane protein (DUF485 family)